MISQYWLRYTLQKDWAFGQMAKKSNEQSVEEMNYADMLIVWIILKAIVGIRVSEEDELVGLDKAELGMEAYPEFANS